MGLPANFKIPGIFTSFDRNTDPGGIAPNNRLLLWGIVPPAAPVPLNTPFQPTGQRQVEQKCMAYSQLTRQYKAAKSQLPAGVGAEIHLIPLAEPAGGTKAVHPITFLASPTFDTTGKGWILGTNTTALADTQCEIDLGGQAFVFAIPSGTLITDIGALAEAAADAVTDLVVVASSAGAVLTLTDRLKGEHGNDLPTRVTFSNPAAGISASPGTITLATDAGSDGVITFSVDDLDAAASITNGDTPALAAPKLRDAINGEAFPLRAACADPVSGVVTLYYTDDAHAHRLSVSDNITGMTSTGAFGTAGAGVPSIATALSKLTGSNIAYKAWCFPGADAASAGTIATHVVAQNATPIEKGQTVHFGLSGRLPSSVASGLTDSTTPKLFTSELFVVHHQPGAVVRAAELAARAAAMVAAEEFQGRNFNGRRLVGTETMPLGTPHRMHQQTLDQQNTAITTFCYSPIVVDSGGYNAVLRSTTTFKPAGPLQDKLTKWSGALIPIYFRSSLRVRLSAKFKEKNLKQYSDPQTNNSVSPKGVQSEIFTLVKEWDAMDLFDGAEGVKEAIRVGVFVSPTRINVNMPFRNVADLDQIDIDAYQA